MTNLEEKSTEAEGLVDPEVDLSALLAGPLGSLTFGELPATVVEATKLAVVDALAVQIAGSTAPGCPEVAEQVAEWGGRMEATVIPFGIKAPAVWAAFANATMARALDFDDVYEKAICHTTATVVPAALAVAEMTQSNGADFIANVAVGRELICRLTLGNRNIHGEHVRSESYNHSAFAAALLAGRSLGLDTAGLVDAMALTYGESLSNRQGVAEGKHSVRVHQGLSAQVGIQAAQLAKRGLTGPTKLLEGKYGYYPVYNAGLWDRSRVLNGLTKDFFAIDASVKLHPCCKQTHAAINGAIALHEKLGENGVAKIAEVTVGLNEHGYYTTCTPPENRWNPVTAMDAQFSAPWQIATALVKGNFFVEDLDPANFKDPAIRAVLPKVKCAIDSQVEIESAGEISSGRVTVRMSDGTEFSEHVRFAKGSPDNPVTLEDILAKLERCLDFSAVPYSEKQRAELRDCLRDLEKLNNISQLVRLLAPNSASE